MRKIDQPSETAHRPTTNEPPDAEMHVDEKLLIAIKQWIAITGLSLLYVWIVDVEGLLPTPHHPPPIQWSSVALLVVFLLLSAILVGRIGMVMMAVGYQTYRSLHAYWTG